VEMVLVQVKCPGCRKKRGGRRGNYAALGQVRGKWEKGKGRSILCPV